MNPRSSLYIYRTIVPRSREQLQFAPYVAKTSKLTTSLFTSCTLTATREIILAPPIPYYYSYVGPKGLRFWTWKLPDLQCIDCVVYQHQGSQVHCKCWVHTDTRVPYCQGHAIVATSYTYTAMPISCMKHTSSSVGISYKDILWVQQSNLSTTKCFLRELLLNARDICQILIQSYWVLRFSNNFTRAIPYTTNLYWFVPRWSCLYKLSVIAVKLTSMGYN